jgi:hypothetical protein
MGGERRDGSSLRFGGEGVLIGVVDMIKSPLVLMKLYTMGELFAKKIPSVEGT